MYAVDTGDFVVPYATLPRPEVGVPEPIVVSDEGTVAVAYRMGEAGVALARFQGYAAYLFGEPNDEAFAGHPLASRGLAPYGSYVVENSSWCRALERQNSVHPNHDPSRYAALRHFVIAFHDSTFECVSEPPEVSLHRVPLESIWLDLQAAVVGRVV